MIINIKSLIAILCTASLCMSCTEKALDSIVQKESVHAEVILPDFSPATKASIATDGSVNWEDGDCLGLFSYATNGVTPTSTQLTLTLSESTSSTASFTTAAGWRMVDNGNYKYVAYYPYDAGNTRSAIAVDYTGQTQTTNDNASHLRDYDYIYSTATVPVSEEYAVFECSHIGALINLELSVPEKFNTASFSRMTLTASSDIFVKKATYDIASIVADGVPDMNVISTGSTFELSFGPDGIKPEEGILSVWLMMMPAELEEETIRVDLYPANVTGYVAAGKLTDIDIQEAGKIYSYKLDKMVVDVIPTDEECMTAFMKKMNEKSTSLGMSNSTWGTPSGLSGNTSTARDLSRMIMAAYKSSPLLREVWRNHKVPHTIHFTDGTSQELVSGFATCMLKDYYPILGGKTGSIGTNKNTLTIVTTIKDAKQNDILVAGAIMGAANEDDRYPAMKELFDACFLALNGHTPSPNIVTSAPYACAYSFTMDNSSDPVCLYAQGADTKAAPASTSKVLSAITALDYITDYTSLVEIHSSDLVGGSGAIFSAGQKLSFEDLMYASMYPSSNQAAMAIGRIAGMCILREESVKNY